MVLGYERKAQGGHGESQADSVAKASVRKPGVIDYLASEQNKYPTRLSPYLPQDLIGGSLPHIPGMEDEAVWNAASQACATEKVHYCYSLDDKRIWYLACPSASLASNPDSWCPLAAALPGNSEYWDRETVYLYEQEGVAAALRWDPETGRMQVYLGAARTILPRVQTMDANFVTINAEVANPVAWKNRALRSEQLSRATARMLLIAGLFVTLTAVTILLSQYWMMFFINRDLGQVRSQTQQAVDDLMMNAASTMQSDTAKHMVRIQELLDSLAKIDGTLLKYEVKGGKVEWEALVPQAYSGGVGSIQGTVSPEMVEGRVKLTGTR